MEQRPRWRIHISAAPAPKAPPWARWLMGLATIATCWPVVDLLVLKTPGGWRRRPR